jgi:hypothetical protein
MTEDDPEDLLGAIPRFPLITCLIRVLAPRITAAPPRDRERCR